MADTPEIVEGERWYLDRRAGTVNSVPAPTGYFTFVFDGAMFADSMNINDDHEWEAIP